MGFPRLLPDPRRQAYLCISRHQCASYLPLARCAEAKKSRRRERVILTDSSGKLPCVHGCDRSSRRHCRGTVYHRVHVARWSTVCDSRTAAQWKPARHAGRCRQRRGAGSSGPARWRRSSHWQLVDDRCKAGGYACTIPTRYAGRSSGTAFRGPFSTQPQSDTCGLTLISRLGALPAALLSGKQHLHTLHFQSGAAVARAVDAKDDLHLFSLFFSLHY